MIRSLQDLCLIKIIEYKLSIDNFRVADSEDLKMHYNNKII